MKRVCVCVCSSWFCDGGIFSTQDMTESVCATTGQCISDPLEEEGRSMLCPHYSYHGNMSNDNADKLDTMMTVVMEYMEGVCYRKGT